jgi:hypothetical protein
VSLAAGREATSLGARYDVVVGVVRVTPSLHVDYKHSRVKQYQCARNAKGDIDMYGR